MASQFVDRVLQGRDNLATLRERSKAAAEQVLDAERVQKALEAALSTDEKAELDPRPASVAFVPDLSKEKK